MNRSRLTPSWRGWRVAVVGLVLPLIQSGCETTGRPPADTRLEILGPPTYSPNALGISPDGEQIVYLSEEQGQGFSGEHKVPPHDPSSWEILGLDVDLIPGLMETAERQLDEITGRTFAASVQ